MALFMAAVLKRSFSGPPIIFVRELTVSFSGGAGNAWIGAYWGNHAGYASKKKRRHSAYLLGGVGKADNEEIARM